MKVPTSPSKSLHVKAERPHCTKQRVHSPSRISPEKSKCVADRQKQQKDRSDSVNQSGFHCVASLETSGLPNEQRAVSSIGVWLASVPCSACRAVAAAPLG